METTWKVTAADRDEQGKIKVEGDNVSPSTEPRSLADLLPKPAEIKAAAATPAPHKFTRHELAGLAAAALAAAFIIVYAWSTPAQPVSAPETMPTAVIMRPTIVPTVAPTLAPTVVPTAIPTMEPAPEPVSLPVLPVEPEPVYIAAPAAAPPTQPAPAPEPAITSAKMSSISWCSGSHLSRPECNSGKITNAQAQQALDQRAP